MKPEKECPQEKALTEKADVVPPGSFGGHLVQLGVIWRSFGPIEGHLVQLGVIWSNWGHLAPLWMQHAASPRRSSDFKLKMSQAGLMRSIDEHNFAKSPRIANVQCSKSPTLALTPPMPLVDGAQLPLSGLL